MADLFVKKLKKGRILNEDEAMTALLKEEIQEEGDFVLDEKAKSVVLTQEGVAKAEKLFLRGQPFRSRKSGTATLLSTML